MTSEDPVALRLLHARHLAAYRWALPFVAGKRVLEIGVNAGYGTRVLQQAAREVVGLDISFAHASTTHAATGAAVVQADGQRLPFAAGSFDAAVSFQVIEHVGDDRVFLAEIRRVCRPGGLILLSTPQRRGRLLRGQQPWNEEHLREYDEEAWRSLLHACLGEDCILTALHGDPWAAAIEARRVAQDPWAYYLPGKWAGPARWAGRRTLTTLGRWRRAEVSAALPTASEETDEELVKHFTVDSELREAALDLLAACRVESGSPPGSAHGFDEANYWAQRHAQAEGLVATGTGGLPQAWQGWLYAGKRRAIRRVLSRHGVSLAGKVVLDLGCGTGFFEDLWEHWGARLTQGIDVVPDVVSRLSRAHPHRHYVCADLGTEPSAVERLVPSDLITAIDVLYHVVDDVHATRVLASLLQRLRPGGWFLFTDALRDERPAPHVRFRSENHWRQILGGLGLQIVAREPTFVVNNLILRGVGRFPWAMGALQHHVDLPLLHAMPWLANNWTLLARKADP